MFFYYFILFYRYRWVTCVYVVCFCFLRLQCVLCECNDIVNHFTRLGTQIQYECLGSSPTSSFLSFILVVPSKTYFFILKVKFRETQMATMFKAAPCWTQEPGILCRFLECVAGTQTLGPEVDKLAMDHHLHGESHLSLVVTWLGGLHKFKK